MNQRESSAWLVEQAGYDLSQTEFLGSKFTVANGYFGYRGTLEEHGAPQLAACTVSELYDDSGSSWREIVNVPNPLHTVSWVNGQSLSVLDTAPLAHRQWLALDTGVHGRQTSFACAGGTVTINAQRFAGADEVHLLCMRYTVCADVPAVLTLRSGIDSEIWELNGPHFIKTDYRCESGCLLFEGETKQMHYRAAVARRTMLSGGLCDCDLEQCRHQADDKPMHCITLHLEPNVPVHMDVFAAICKSTDCESPAQQALALAQSAAQQGWHALLARQTSALARRWHNFDVQIDGDDAAQLALRHSIFLLAGAAPFHTEGIAIPARGLSGQVYKGGMFWDTELYFLPMFLHCAPQVARSLVTYRIKNLAGALAKAAEEGYTGAFYPWESQETGEEGCTYYNLTDIFTGRPVRTYFRDKQIHISAAVAYGIYTYVRTTGDESLLVEGGAQTLLECAEFFWSYAYYKVSKQRFELLDVTGPDEYHERVNNNAYTNAMACETAQWAQWAIALLREKHPNAYSALAARTPHFAEKQQHAKALASELYVPAPRPADGVIEQYDGFFGREDCSLETLKSRVINPNEYLGSPTGLTVNTQIAKQADIALLLCVLGQNYTQAVKAANWSYYEPRCEHGSSLSTCVYALLAAQIGNTDWAYRFFLRAAQTDLLGGYKLYLGPLYIGGTHPAANGGSWLVAVQGFGGLSLESNRAVLAPHLPAHWTRLAYRFCVQGQWFGVQLTAHTVQVTADASNLRPFAFSCEDKTQCCNPGERICFLLSGIAPAASRV